MKKWKPENCSCRLCKAYINQSSFIQMKKIELPQQIKSELALFNNTHREKLCFTQFRTRICWNRSCFWPFVVFLNILLRFIYDLDRMRQARNHERAIYQSESIKTKQENKLLRIFIDVSCSLLVFFLSSCYYYFFLT